ncbi:hypothetical protein AB0L70_15050 [Kribbella sp. NPDC051952]|uniref:hypothetical protein n=1 Tax=Kribbella sp. NPDC051952 TaxID=3154851 RepID=UPI00342F6743
MSLQLWVVIVLMAVLLGLLAVVRMRRARQVFDDITRVDRPAHSGIREHPRDELAHARAQARHARTEPVRHRRHG